jgi:hypothetical protein
MEIFSNIIGLGLLTIILVSSANKTTSALSFIDFGRSFIYIVKKAIVQVLILVGHHTLSIPNMSWNHEGCCPKSFSDICLLNII